MNEYLLNIDLKMETLRLAASQFLQARLAIQDMTMGLLFFPLFY